MAAVAWDHGSARPARPSSTRAHLRLVADGERPGGPGPRGLPAPVYRRRRMAVAAVAVAVVAVVAVGTGAGDAPPALRDVAATGPPTTLVVGPDDTVWDLVAPHVPDGAHPMAYVIEVAAYNDVDPRAVPPGTVLRLPPVGP